MDTDNEQARSAGGDIPTRPTIPMLIPWVRDWYGRHPAGGVLHIVLDDCNVKDFDVEWCERQAIECGDIEGARLAQTLRYMTTTQRRKISMAAL